MVIPLLTELIDEGDCREQGKVPFAFDYQNDIQFAERAVGAPLLKKQIRWNRV